jgi:hypothetical protein
VTVPPPTAPAARRGPVSALAALTTGIGASLGGWAIPVAAVPFLAVGGTLTRILRRPARWLAVLTWLLPFHIAIIAALFGAFGLPGAMVRGIAAWKEIAVALLLAAVAARALGGHGSRSRVGGTDLAVAALVLLALAHLLVDGAWLGGRVPAVGQLYGLRDAAYFSLLYFVGRATPEVARDVLFARRLFAVGIITCVLAVLERLFVPPELLVLAGVSTYFQDFLGVAAFTVSNEYGLPDNYWTWIGGAPVRRAGSVYLSSQGFAVPFLLIVPAATLWVLERGRRRLLPWAGYTIVWIGLLLSVTRMTIAVCLLQVLLVAVLRRRWGVAMGMVLTGVFAAALAMAVEPKVAHFVWDTLTWDTASSTSHAKDWSSGIEAMAERPLGAGLATADQTAVRAGMVPLTADNLYLKYGVELGLPGLVLLPAVLFAFAAAGATAYTGSKLPGGRVLGAVVLVTTVGIAINAVTAVVFNSTVLAYLYFWLAGTTVTIAQRVRRSLADETG